MEDGDDDDDDNSFFARVWIHEEMEYLWEKTSVSVCIGALSMSKIFLVHRDAKCISHSSNTWHVVSENFDIT